MKEGEVASRPARTQKRKLFQNPEARVDGVDSRDFGHAETLRLNVGAIFKADLFLTRRRG